MPVLEKDFVSLTQYICGLRGGTLRQLYAALTFSLMVLEIVAVLCALAQPAYAYIDPGSGLLSLQIISTTFAGMIFMLRKSLRGFLRHMIDHPGPKSKKANQK